MKLLILSDSHGHISPMKRAVELVSPNLIIHLGDCWRDAEVLHECFPVTSLLQVPGNCDYRPSEAAEKLLCLQDKRILLCHGHTYGVKQSMMAAGYAAEEQSLDLFLFGHTHRPFLDKRGNCLFLNPGSIGDSLPPSYGLVTLLDGVLDAHPMPLI